MPETSARAKSCHSPFSLMRSVFESEALIVMSTWSPASVPVTNTWFPERATERSRRCSRSSISLRAMSMSVLSDGKRCGLRRVGKLLRRSRGVIGHACHAFGRKKNADDRFGREPARDAHAETDEEGHAEYCDDRVNRVRDVCRMTVLGDTIDLVAARRVRGVVPCGVENRRVNDKRDGPDRAK